MPLRWLQAVFMVGLLVFIAWVCLPCVPAWWHCFRHGFPLRFVTVLAMRIRRTPTLRLARSYVRARREGVEVSARFLETHYLAGGDMEFVVDEAIACLRSDRAPDLDLIASADLNARVDAG